MCLEILIFAEMIYIFMVGDITLPLGIDKKEVCPYKVASASLDLPPCYGLSYVPSNLIC